jgi:hypothetical protein
MIMIVLLCYDKTSGDLLLETTDNETLYDLSTVLPINISDNIELVTDILLNNITNNGKFYFLIYSIYLLNIL